MVSLRRITLPTILLAVAARSSHSGYSFTDSDNADCNQRCFTTEVSAWQTVKGPVWLSTSPRDHLIRPALSAVNGSAWEQWYFDLVSSTGDQSMGLCVSRDPSYKMFGKGILRVEFFVALSNGTIIGSTDFVDSSLVRECCGEVRGEWASNDRSYSFRVSKDFSRAEAEFNRPDMSGTFSLSAIAKPRYSDGSMWPSDTANHEVSPLLHITEPMPAGDARVSFTLAGASEPITWSGIGGHNRIWSSLDWFSIVRGWHNGRARVGPYVISLFEDVSKIDGQTYQGSVLFKDGEPVLQSKLRGPHSESKDEDHHLITRRYGGKVHSHWGDTSTGWTLDFVSPSRGKHWRFELEHHTLAFEVDLGPNKGLGGFTDIVSGGEVGGEQYGGGVGVSEQVFLPEAMSIRLMLGLAWQVIATSDTNLLKSIWQIATAVFK